jgi:hypothetical protein
MSSKQNLLNISLDHSTSLNFTTNHPHYVIVSILQFYFLLVRAKYSPYVSKLPQSMVFTRDEDHVLHPGKTTGRTIIKILYLYAFPDQKRTREYFELNECIHFQSSVPSFRHVIICKRRQAEASHIILNMFVLSLSFFCSFFLCLYYNVKDLFLPLLSCLSISFWLILLRSKDRRATNSPIRKVC